MEKRCEFCHKRTATTTAYDDLLEFEQAACAQCAKLIEKMLAIEKTEKASIRKKQNPNTLWVCCGCGRKLPKTGYVWKYRHGRFLSSCDATTTSSGYYCDPCADRRESGMDY